MTLRLVVVAGDRREQEAASYLAALGHTVRHVAAPDSGVVDADVASVFATADAVVGPALGTNSTGDSFHRAGALGALRIDTAWLRNCRPGTPWIVGRAGPWLAGVIAELGLTLHTYADRDEFALRNAIPTAEGAILEACRRSGRTAWDTSVLVVGGGRCARALIPRLRALGAPVACAARSASARAEAEMLGAEPVSWPRLAEAASGRLWVFNTVPAPVITRPVLAALPAEAVVVDIASAPGGTDFDAARALGIDAALVLGIPGRMFPRTAGRIVAEAVSEIVDAVVGVPAAHGA